MELQINSPSWSDKGLPGESPWMLQQMILCERNSLHELMSAAFTSLWSEIQGNPGFQRVPVSGTVEFWVGGRILRVRSRFFFPTNCVSLDKSPSFPIRN